MNRDFDDHNEEFGDDFDDFDPVSQSMQGLQSNEEDKQFLENENTEIKAGLYISLTSAQYEAASKHIPISFKLIEKAKLK